MFSQPKDPASGGLEDDVATIEELVDGVARTVTGKEPRLEAVLQGENDPTFDAAKDQQNEVEKVVGAKKRREGKGVDGRRKRAKGPGGFCSSQLLGSLRAVWLSVISLILSFSPVDSQIPANPPVAGPGDGAGIVADPSKEDTDPRTEKPSKKSKKRANDASNGKGVVGDVRKRAKKVRVQSP